MSGYPNNDNTNTTTTMTDSYLRFAVYCVGSNKLLAADLAIRFNKKDVRESSYELQRQVAALAGVVSTQYIKITLGSPAGPQLTPLLRSLDALLQEIKDPYKDSYFKRDKLLEKATKTTWLKLLFSKVNTVFVTQHNHSAFNVSRLVWAYAGGMVSYMYNMLPRAVQCDPAVFLTAYILVNGLINVPDELKSNKTFALYCFKRYDKSLCYLGLSHFDALQDDKDVVVAAVNRDPRDFYSASPNLKADKAFVIKVVGVNGLCIQWAAADLKQDKDVALAAVRQNKEAAKYLCAELQEDKDIVAACANNYDGSLNDLKLSKR